jgi:N-acyl-D-aspartate/D-glutamate deacylase
LIKKRIYFRADQRLLLLLDQCTKITGKTRSRLIRDGIKEVVQTTLRGRGVGVQLYPLFQELRFYVAKLDVPTIRESLAAKLMAAIDDVHKRAQKAKDEKARVEYYRVMGYLCQILNGLLENVSTDELMRRIEEAKTALEAHQKRSGPNG